MTEETKSVATSENVSSPSLLSGEQATDPQGQLTAAVDDLLDQLQHKFDNVSREMFGKLDEMVRRLDELEASLHNTSDADPTSPAK
ncbi:heat shock factor-binding 1 family protein [Aspergillus tanneri]|uniref:Heat shock factor-binding protein 1 n=1 Tax=Aspergillus tanneri TaxID=1220188 RepID=A0A5M9N0F6_9EURO|nr:uncharacterized protein ATNIH1004_001473 [Aspergillus tanneri]KAA8652568.1 hypothetical protein ATNIH1004_001473 [Aspergillus tanneri]